jgi:hypothetical protein
MPVWQVTYSFGIIRNLTNRKSQLLRFYNRLGLCSILNKNLSLIFHFKHIKGRFWALSCQRDGQTPAHNHPLASGIPLSLQLVMSLIPGFLL